MKIAYIGSRGFPGFHAGVEKSLEEICPRLAKRGHEITLYCSDQVTTTDLYYKKIYLKRTPAIPTKHFETFSRTLLSAYDALFRKFDIIHFHSIGPALVSWLTRIAHCKTVVTVHGLDWQRAKWGFIARSSLQIGEKSSIYFPHKTIVVSKFLERYFKSRYNKDVTYIPNGVSEPEILPANRILKEWGLEPQSYILFASRLVPEKECHTLIQAFRQVDTQKKLVIAGSSWHSDHYVASLKQLADGDPRILFVGWANGEILSELYSNAFMFCLPSKIEGLSLALLEAMSFGVCPLISNIPENLDVVGNHGVAFKVGQIGDLVCRLEASLSNPEKTQKTGASAKDFVLKNYSWDQSCEDLEKTYMKLLGKN